jgi:glutamate racemase
MRPARILIFDSGTGGLTVAQAIRAQMPDADLVYAADNAAFPYGAWKENDLIRRIVTVLGKLLDRVRPDIVVVACNTASTIAMIPVRRSFALPFVGTVPAIKPAAAATKTGIIGVLATPGTVSREYTHNLVESYASHCKVVLHGAKDLARIAEEKLAGKEPEPKHVLRQIAPAFMEHEGRRTDVVVLGCTHYPLLLDEMRAVAPWEVLYIDPAPAIARRTTDVLGDMTLKELRHSDISRDTVLLTGRDSSATVAMKAYAAMGFSHHQLIDLPVT